MSRAVLQPFIDYQKARVTFVQTIAELSTRPQNIDALYSAGVMSLLRPLLLDTVSSVQQSAALAIGRLANFSEELAESVVQNDIITQLISSLTNQNRFFKKAACFVLKSVAKHSPQLADDVVKCGALEPLVQCLDEFEPSVKEAAAWALGYIAKHNASLAYQVKEANAVDSLILCLSEPEILLKRVAALTLSYICQHTEQLAQPVAENGLETITTYLNYNDTQLKRNICHLLGNITKHSPDLATLVLTKITHPQRLLNCLKDPDDTVKRNAAICINEIVNKTPENAQAINSSGGPAILVEFITNIKGDARLHGILTLGSIAAFGDRLAMDVIKAKAVSQLRDALQNEPHQHIKSAACFALGHIGRHSNIHAKDVSDANVLSLMLYYYLDPGSSEDLRYKTKKALKSIISNCSNLSALEPLLHAAPEKILKYILNQYVRYLKDSNNEKKNFLLNGGFQKLQEIKLKVDGPLQQLISEINSNYTDEIIKYYSPDYAAILLNKIETYSNL
jgi:hypothetical protein